MRIDKLEIENFKKYARQTLHLHPRFTLLIGENGAGKTTILEALAVAAGVWLEELPDASIKKHSRRDIALNEIRLEAERLGDRLQFRECRPVRIKAEGSLGQPYGMIQWEEPNLAWTRELRAGDDRTTTTGALEEISHRFDFEPGMELLFPVLAFYGAGRAWLPSHDRTAAAKKKGAARRWAAFYDCFNERIRVPDLNDWFLRESIERGNRSGHWRPGFDVVRRAVLRCVPGADDLRFDSDRNQIVLSIAGQPLPMDNLSAGQRMMLALVADLAIKAVTQNAFLIPPEGLTSDRLPDVLAKTPGLVLIDELDVHLHPNWQRRVARDLKATFPSIQFVCTTHSPQVIGELPVDEIRVLDGDRVFAAPHSFGVDSSRILEEIMHSKSRTDQVDTLLHDLSREIDAEKLDAARDMLPRLEALLGPDDPEVLRARGLIDLLSSAL